MPSGYNKNDAEGERKEDEENSKMIAGAKEFASTLSAMAVQIADHEERMIRMERLHHELGGKRIIKG